MRATWSLALFGQGALHLSNPQPPDASSKLVVNKLALRLDVLHAVHNRATRSVHHRLRLLEMQGWMFGASDGLSPARTCGASPSMLESHSVCHTRLHLPDAHYLPKSLRDTIQAERGAWMAAESRLARSRLQVVSLGTTRLDIKGAQAESSEGMLPGKQCMSPGLRSSSHSRYSLAKRTPRRATSAL